VIVLINGTPTVVQGAPGSTQVLGGLTINFQQDCSSTVSLPVALAGGGSTTMQVGRRQPHHGTHVIAP
jgi:hypothetical protein